VGKNKEVLKGKRIELIYCADEHTNLKPGNKGTILFVDDTGTIHPQWDNGSMLGLVPNVDSYKLIENN